MSNGVKTANSAKYGPTISLPDGTEFGFTFGIKKARIVLEYLEAVRAFVASHEPVKPTATANHNGNGANGRPVMRPLPVLATSIPRPVDIVIRNGWAKPTQPEPESLSEETIRAEDYCRGCNADKSGQGLLVCWGCFKRHPVNPLQSSGLSVEEWIGKFGKFDGKGGAL